MWGKIRRSISNRFSMPTDFEGLIWTWLERRAFGIKIQLFIKRCIDFLFSAVILLFFSPLLMLVAIIIIIDDGWPVLFIQERVGKNGQLYHLLKFRSMRNPNGKYLSEADRITKFGSFLRSTGLDEMPQFFNVLKGNMSIVGPRPAPPGQVIQYDGAQSKRLLMKPGITGWTAVNGGHNLYTDDKILLDLWYIKHFSIFLDLKIILKTPWVMLSGRPSYFDKVDDTIIQNEKKLDT